MSTKEIHINQAATVIAAHVQGESVRKIRRKLQQKLPGKKQYLSQEKLNKEIREVHAQQQKRAARNGK